MTALSLAGAAHVSWLRTEGNEITVHCRRYAHLSGASIAVHAIPAVAPGGVWLDLWRQACRTAAGRPVAVALDAGAPAPWTLTAFLWKVLEGRLTTVGWYRDWTMIPDLFGAEFVLSAPARARLGLRAFRTYRDALRAWVLGHAGDPLVASGPVLTSSTTNADWAQDVPWNFYGAVMASPRRAQQIHDHLTRLGFSSDSSDHVAIGRWVGIPQPVEG